LQGMLVVQAAKKLTAGGGGNKHPRRLDSSSGGRLRGHKSEEGVFFGELGVSVKGKSHVAMSITPMRSVGGDRCATGMGAGQDCDRLVRGIPPSTNHIRAGVDAAGVLKRAKKNNFAGADDFSGGINRQRCSDRP